MHNFEIFIPNYLHRSISFSTINPHSRRRMIVVYLLQTQNGETKAGKIYRNVHTSYSFIDSTNAVKDKCIGNRSKSQANVLEKGRSISQEEIKEWFNELSKERKLQAWTHRLQRVARSLTNPEREDNLRIKLRRYLEKVPSEFSDCDEEGRLFREQLPDNILRKLKKIYAVDEKRSTKVFRVELCKNNQRDELKLLIRDWMKKVRLNKTEYVEKDSIVNALALILDSNIGAIKSKSDFKILKRSLIKVINDLPLDVSCDIKHLYVHKMATDLIKSVINQNENVSKKRSIKSRINFSDFVEKSSCNSADDDVAKPTPKDIMHFVRDDLNILYSRADIEIGKKRMNYIQIDVTNVLIDAIESMKLTNKMKADIRTTLHEIGNLTEYQAKYFTKILLKDFRSAFCKDYEKSECKRELATDACRNNHNVFYNTITNKAAANGCDENILKCIIETNSKVYVQQVEKAIEAWLTEIQFKVQFKPGTCLRKIAISDLAEDILERRKYLQLNSESKGSKEDELNHLKFQIYKWLGKLIGNLNLVDYASLLNEYLQTLHEPDLVGIEPNECKDIQFTFLDKQGRNIKKVDTVKHKKLIKPNTNYLDRISEAVFDWIQELPDKMVIKKIRYHQLKSLAENIERGLDNSKLLEPIFDDEIDFWTANVLGCELNTKTKENLKDRIETLIYLEDMYDLLPKTSDGDDNVILSDASLQVKTVTCNRAINTEVKTEELKPLISMSSSERNCKDIEEIVMYIKDWLQPLNIKQIHENPFKNVALNDLAGDIYDRRKYLEINLIPFNELDELNHLKYQIFKWFNQLVGDEINVMVDNAESLIDKLNDRRVIDSHSIFSREAVYDDANVYCDSGFVFKDLDDDDTISNEDICTSTKDLLTPGTSEDVKASLISTIISDSFFKVVDINEDEIDEQSTEDKYVGTEEIDVPKGLSTKQTYEYYDKYFKKWCRELPVTGTSYEIESLGNVAKKGIYNGIWKSFFKYKSEIDIIKDHELFVSMFEDRLDVLLDYLPQTECLSHYRNTWKKKIVFAVSGMVKYIFNIKDDEIKQALIRKFNKEFLKSHFNGTADGLQQSFIANVINAYILYLRYKHEGVESNFYRQRLMSKLEQLSDHVKRQYKEEFRFISTAAISQEAFLILVKLPPLDADIIKREADEIVLSEEIDSWKAGLANIGITKDKSEAAEVLTKKIHSLLKHKDCITVRDEIKREIAELLKEFEVIDKEAELMAGQLVTRLEDKGLITLGFGAPGPMTL